MSEFRYATLIAFKKIDKMAAVGHFGCPKFTLDHISGHFRTIQIFCFDFFCKMAAGRSQYCLLCSVVYTLLPL